MLAIAGLVTVALFATGRWTLDSAPTLPGEERAHGTGVAAGLVEASDSPSRPGSHTAARSNVASEERGDLGTLHVTLKRDDGSVLRGTPVQVIGAAWREEWSNEVGQASFQLAPGEYEVMIPSGKSTKYLAIYAPEGRSDATAVLVTGETTEVELIAYGGAKISGQLVLPEGQTARRADVELYAWNGDEWETPVELRADELGRFTAEGLAEGTYALVPGDRPGLHFAGENISLAHGEQRSVTLNCYTTRKVVLDITTRSKRSGDVLPLWLSARAERVRDPESTAMPGDDEVTDGRTLGIERITLQLFPGQYALDLFTATSLPHSTQVVENGSWNFDLSVAVDSEVTQRSFELTLEDTGPFAHVAGRLLGEKDETGGRVAYQVRFEHPEEGTKSAWLHPRSDGTFVLVADLALIQGGVVEFVERRGSVETVLHSMRLVAGEQELELRRP